MQGDLLRACLNKSRTRAEPTPKQINIDNNFSEPRHLRNECLKFVLTNIHKRRLVFI